MLIKLESRTAQNMTAARRQLDALAVSWDHQITQTPAPAIAPSGEEKAVDPVAVATLVLSIPSTALAALDLADRIRKRHRAQELISHAQQLATQQVTIYLITDSRTTDIRTLSPDQLLDQAAEDDPAT